MFVELKHIRQPKPQTLALLPKSMDKPVSKKAKVSQKHKKVTCRGDKSKDGRKTCELAPQATPPPPRPSRRKWQKVDYLKLNDGLDDPITKSPKPKRAKPYSPPPREGPSASQQAARKRKHVDYNTDLRESLDDIRGKLPDLVLNSGNPETFNGGTIAPSKNGSKTKAKKQKASSSKNIELWSDNEFNGIQTLPENMNSSTFHIVSQLASESDTDDHQSVNERTGWS